MGKYYYKVAEREELCKKYLSSGLSQKEFCAQEGINAKVLSKWLHKDSAQRFKFLQIGEVKTESSIAEIKLPNGILLRLDIGLDKLSLLLRELLSCK